MNIVGHCPWCGAPIYGFRQFKANYLQKEMIESPKIFYTCECISKIMPFFVDTSKEVRELKAKIDALPLSPSIQILPREPDGIPIKPYPCIPFTGDPLPPNPVVTCNGKPLDLRASKESFSLYISVQQPPLKSNVVQSESPVVGGA